VLILISWVEYLGTYTMIFPSEGLILSFSSWVTVLKMISFLAASSCILVTVALNSWNSKYILIYLLMSLLSVSIFLPSFTLSLKSWSVSLSFLCSIKNLMTMNSRTSFLLNYHLSIWGSWSSGRGIHQIGRRKYFIRRILVRKGDIGQLCKWVLKCCSSLFKFHLRLSIHHFQSSTPQWCLTPLILASPH